MPSFVLLNQNTTYAIEAEKQMFRVVVVVQINFKCD